jgi:hypothetical protein
MFCDRCGTSLNDTQAYCPSCGKATEAAPRAPAPQPNRVAGHVRLLGIFWLAYSAVQLMGSWFLASIFPRFFDSRFFSGWGWSPHIPFLVGGLLRAVGWVLLARGVLGVIAGWGLLDRQPWARILAIVLAVFTLLHLVLGTALGIYTLWVLLPRESEREYRQMARPA